MSLLQYVRWKEYKLCSMHALACVYRKFCKVLRFLHFYIFYLLPKFNPSSGAGISFNILSVYSKEGEWTYIRRQSKNVWDFKLTLLKGIKGTVPRDYQLQVFLWISFPQAPEYPIRAVSNSRRYSQLEVLHRCHWNRLQMEKKSSIRNVLNILFGHLWVAEVTYR